MDVSIVISNYTSKGRLLSCVDHALSQDSGAGDYEVVLPLHGTITGPELDRLQARAAADGRLRLLAGERHNRARALNEAVEGAASERLVFLESHVRAPPGLAARYRDVLGSPDVVAVQGAYVAGASGNWAWEAEAILTDRTRMRRLARGLTPDEFHLHSAGFRRRAILDAGGFDERVPDIAEIPLLHRIQAGGGRIVALEAPAVDHANYVDFRTYADGLRHRGRGVGVLWRLDSGLTSELFQSTKLERHEALIRRAHRPLRLACKAQLFLILLALDGIGALRLRPLMLPAASAMASAALRAGFLEGYATR